MDQIVPKLISFNDFHLLATAYPHVAKLSSRYILGKLEAGQSIRSRLKVFSFYQKNFSKFKIYGQSFGKIRLDFFWSYQQMENLTQKSQTS